MSHTRGGTVFKHQGGSTRPFQDEKTSELLRILQEIDELVGMLSEH
jgi:hypothetical protein